MDYTLSEIKKYKIILNNLTIKLINVTDIKEEISINNEIKTTNEFLSTLLNIKNNFVNQQPFQNNLMNLEHNPNNNINNNIINTPIQQEAPTFQILLNNEENKPKKKYKHGKIYRLPNGRFASLKRSSKKRNNVDNSNDLKIIFRQADGTFATQIFFAPQEKVEDIIQSYRIKTGDYNPGRRFIINNKDLSPNLSLAEAGIENCSSIIVKDVEINNN